LYLQCCCNQVSSMWLSLSLSLFFFFNNPSSPEIYTLSLHDALPISSSCRWASRRARCIAIRSAATLRGVERRVRVIEARRHKLRSEEHTSELQSPYDLVCRLLLEKKKNNYDNTTEYEVTRRGFVCSN